MKQSPGIFRLLTMRCADVVQFVSQAQDRDMTRSERFALRLHFMYCTACRRYRKQIAALREALRLHVKQVQQLKPGGPLALPPEARARISQALTTHD
jgi:predicted anti-sigma-YlaC factor YlaD